MSHGAPQVIIHSQVGSHGSHQCRQCGDGDVLMYYKQKESQTNQQAPREPNGSSTKKNKRHRVRQCIDYLHIQLHQKCAGPGNVKTQQATPTYCTASITVGELLLSNVLTGTGQFGYIATVLTPFQMVPSTHSSVVKRCKPWICWE
jgi:hypothetical protein